MKLLIWTTVISMVFGVQAKGGGKDGSDFFDSTDSNHKIGHRRRVLKGKMMSLSGQAGGAGRNDKDNRPLPPGAGGSSRFDGSVGLVEVRPCIPFDKITDGQKLHPRGDSECQTNSCPDGCCRGKFRNGEATMASVNKTKAKKIL